MPKCGTTWLQALVFSIANRDVFSIDQSPLLTSNPHTLVPYLEYTIYQEQENLELENIPRPRILATHVPFEILPDCIRESECRIIYICRNPLDQFVSHHRFLLENKNEKDAVVLELDEVFDMFCQGIQPFGPFWDHMLGYWNAHLKKSSETVVSKDLEVNKSGYAGGAPIKNSSLFRKGEVGDWINHLTPAMAERVKNLMESKFQDSGLIFKI
ncbi:UNVERIFIED_CONTAM: Cytosolic sulfotransferase 15 [Sesamum angustifolium]|uniref:Sulfotransferase n=1 Tax=Sesamum angustifolium TaxID=2727405 RepID=A0AAW2IS44_9LAMI